MEKKNKVIKKPKSENQDLVNAFENYFKKSMGTDMEKLSNFPKYIPRQDITKFLAKYEIFKKILNVEGNIIECGVREGSGLMGFAQFSAIFEPANYTRKIIGFDTFSGFPSLSIKDKGSTSPHVHKGGMAINSFQDLHECIKLYDSNRFIGQISKIELVKGDATKTIPKYLKQNPHTVVSLLYLDFDIYKPTKIALQNFVPRMPKGSIIVFDEINSKEYMGETQAVLDTIGIRNLRIQRFNFNTYMSYVVME